MPKLKRVVAALTALLGGWSVFTLTIAALTSAQRGATTAYALAVGGSFSCWLVLFVVACWCTVHAIGVLGGDLE